jgi:hypothetical protein
MVVDLGIQSHCNIEKLVMIDAIPLTHDQSPRTRFALSLPRGHLNNLIPSCIQLWGSVRPR